MIFHAGVIPCPFCGGEARSHKTDIRPGYQTSSVGCKKCQAQIGRCDLDAEAFWNRRHQSDWQPISTAPKDGTPFLILGMNDGEFWEVPEVAYWESDMPYEGTPGFVEYGNASDGTYWNPTHWMPLPPKPEEGDAVPARMLRGCRPSDTRQVRPLSRASSQSNG